MLRQEEVLEAHGLSLTEQMMAAAVVMLRDGKVVWGETEEAMACWGT